MKRMYYIFTPGKLKRKENTVFYVPFKNVEPQDDENLQNEVLLSVDSDMAESLPTNKIVLPVQDIDSFYIMTEASFNTKFLDFCSANKIPIHFFNYYGFYSGTYYPKEYLLSGSLLVNQVKHYSSISKRLEIARKFIEGAAFNLSKNLKYYNTRNKDLQAQIDTMEGLAMDIPSATSIEQLMGIEGNIRKVYYTGFEEILGKEFELISRKYNPPSNPLNALISFSNMMVYTTVLSEIYRTQLNPTISFLHEPGDRRFSLALDIAEIFKPLFADRLIFKMINNRQIQTKDFESRLNGYYLKDTARKAFVQEYDEKLKTTIKHRKLQKEISYRRIIRLECYKLIKHLIGDTEYEPFKIWW
ncbi:MAG: type I-B CRISPR-associated endonuclease Cas1 [Candidatus Kapabacteria bacterium]|nr:type I-B CRISPR-associated endonuclease Cas1 [Ignavibacteriota bacterium]MCW5883399.1 type I-B CRISPR-associated endonuclease Cas1 [Candidatus Kapabacteria bacterium]